MASLFASESGQSRTNAPRLCYCGESSSVKTSMTSGNMGRRFYGCARYGVDVTCGYFEWVDPPMCQRGREVLPRMVAKMNRLENELARTVAIAVAGVDEAVVVAVLVAVVVVAEDGCC
ncbi:hypothetical protein HYC85_001418 [Camellia sinensis]|uniref:GRF-type domain-containing protein n=1 Tax=Camellia sinensis TaxID=4442 RepID=A0A7J7I5M2_CAMSI|nr:hypothetical protein HYC85_001418 [Camellia sinensis]